MSESRSDEGLPRGVLADQKARQRAGFQLPTCELVANRQPRAPGKAWKSCDPAGLAPASVNRWRPFVGRPDSRPCPGRGGPEEPAVGSGAGLRVVAGVGRTWADGGLSDLRANAPTHAATIDVR